MEYLSPRLKAAPEQAARGIANIPFDVMDAGVGVVNAAQSAGAWAGQQLGMGMAHITQCHLYHAQ